MNKLKCLFISVKSLEGTGARYGTLLRKKLIFDEFDNVEEVEIKKAYPNAITLIKYIAKNLKIFSLISTKYLNFQISRRNHYDLVYVDTLHLAWIANLNISKKTIISLHNYDPLYIRSLAISENSIFKRVYYYFEAAAAERIINKLSDMKNIEIWTLTNKDRDDLLKQNRSLNNITKIVPHKLPEFQAKYFKNIRKSLENLTLVFIGSGKHAPNKEALNFIVEILSIDKKMNLKVFGPDWNAADYQGERNIKFYGYVEDLTKFINRSESIFICPTFSGSGINMKILTSIELSLGGVISKFAANAYTVYGARFPEQYYRIIDESRPIMWVNAIREHQLKLSLHD